MGFKAVEIRTDFNQAKELEDQIVAEAQACGYDEENLFALRLSLAEALANAIRHGNHQQKNKRIRVVYNANKRYIEIFIEDEGQGFNPQQVPDPTLDENLENPTGRGIMLMRAYMNLVEYNKLGNRVHMLKLNRGE